MSAAESATAVTGQADDPLLAQIRAGVRVYDLGRPMFTGMPQSPNHPRYSHSLPRRHGDVVRVDGGSAANDLIVTGTHVGTHVDALAHVSQDGRLHGGADAARAGRGGRYLELGVHTVPPMVRRGVLLDVPGARGEADCPAGYEITVEDLRRAAQAQRTRIGAGDVVLIRSGWGQLFEDPDPARYLGAETGVPGIGAAAARWLVGHGVVAAGADTIAFEQLAPGAGHSRLPVHRIMLVEHGVYLIETMDLEALARARVYEFTFVMAPLALVGATGSPVRPLAVVADRTGGESNG